MHYKILRAISVGLAEERPGYLFCLPEQGFHRSSVHGGLHHPLTPAKLDSSEFREEAASYPPVFPTNHQVPANNPTLQDNETHEKPAEDIPQFKDVSTITDVCTNGDVPEVEIFSLLQERLPHYTLRANTTFGYDHDNWLHTPLLPPDLPFRLTPEQIEETLKYFLLCSERVGRITKTYRDIDAVTSLLEEKERDLELAARIGQSLLKQNRELTARNEYLEEQLEAAKEEVYQLRHEVSMREDLLHLYTSNLDSESTSAIATPLPRNHSSFCLEQDVHLDALQQKLKILEEDNQKMRNEASHILDRTNDYEDQESSLMLDCVEQFSEVSKQVALLAEELARRGEDAARQQEEISQLLAQIVHLQQKCRTNSAENEELHQHLAAVKERECFLKTELQDLLEKHRESEEMLHEAQEELKNQRNRSLPNSSISRYSTLNIFPLDSLAAEIEGTMRKGIDASSELKSYKRVFETVKAANLVVRSRGPSQRPSAAPSRVGTPPMSFCESENSSMVQLEEETLLPGEGNESSVAGEKKLGTPGTPGGQDLAAALQRLSAQQESDSSDLFMEREHKLQRVGEVSSGCLTPNDSILSTGTNYSGISEASGSSSLSMGSRCYLPEKLQIVKPLEGSATLLHWQQLAKPNLGGILDPRPGVLTKDFQELDIDVEDVYNLNDFEEDEPISFQATMTSTPTKNRNMNSMFSSNNNLPQTPSTFTITTCRTPHSLQDITMVTSSLRNTVLSSCGSYESISSLNLDTQKDQTATSAAASHDQTSSGRNTPMGLVTLLQEHGISATAEPSKATSTENEIGPPVPIARHSFLPLSWGRTLMRLGFGRSLVDSATVTKTSDSAPTQKNTFSLNLVGQLQRLGLNRVAERGSASFQRTTEDKNPPS
ncbi:huntingtin-associated protein 1 isoform X1 [Aquarana catesbeiana]|uniref:huntingtin-associated protein 1 isoform X1 n=1 Tax=Aquarana catesbeiana TaxID=8400 RepID=UPI003CC9D906